MPIPLGIFATAGGGGGGSAGAYELISTTTLGADTATVTFSSILQTYKHLQIRMVARSTNAGARTDSTVIRYNGDTASTRSSHYLHSDGLSVTSGANTSAALIVRNITGPTNSLTGNYGATIIDILDYTNITNNKTYRALGGLTHPDSGNSFIALTSGFSISTSAISSVTLLTNSAANFLTGSRFSLYGIKG